RQELQRDEATEFDVLSLVDDTHSPTAELFDDSVVRDRLTHEFGRCAHWREWYAAVVQGVNSDGSSDKRLRVALRSRWRGRFFVWVFRTIQKITDFALADMQSMLRLAEQVPKSKTCSAKINW